MIYFVDASALVKLYHEEVGTEVMQELLDDPDRIARFYISDHVGLEVVVRLNRVKRSLPRSERRRLRSAIASCDEDRARSLNVLPAEPNLVRSAESLASSFADSGAGTLDMIHLASALQVQQNVPGEQLVFVVSDRKLKYVATRAGFPTFDPERERAEQLGQ